MLKFIARALNAVSTVQWRRSRIFYDSRKGVYIFFTPRMRREAEKAGRLVEIGRFRHKKLILQNPLLFVSDLPTDGSRHDDFSGLVVQLFGKRALLRKWRVEHDHEGDHGVFIPGLRPGKELVDFALSTPVHRNEVRAFLKRERQLAKKENPSAWRLFRDGRPMPPPFSCLRQH